MAFRDYLIPEMGREWFSDNEVIRKYIALYTKPLERVEIEIKTPAALPTPIYRKGVNCHLYDLIMEKRKTQGFENLGVAQLAKLTSVRRSRIHALTTNAATRYAAKDMDALAKFFNCGYGDLLKLHRDEQSA